jgi:hypothetical protein
MYCADSCAREILTVFDEKRHLVEIEKNEILDIFQKIIKIRKKHPRSPWDQFSNFPEWVDQYATMQNCK